MSESDKVRDAARAVAAVGAADVAREAAREARETLNTPGGAADWPRKAGIAGVAIGVVAAGVAFERLTVHRAVRRRARAALDAAGPYGSLRGTRGSAVAEDGTELYYEVEEPADFTGGPGEAAASGDGVGGPEVDSVRLDGARHPNGAEAGHSDAAGQEHAEPQEHTDGSMGGAQRGLLLRLLRGARERAGEAGEPGGMGVAGEAGAAGEAAPLTVVFSHGYCLNQDVWHFQRAALRGAVRTVYWDQRSHGRSDRAPVGERVSIDLLGRDLKAVLDAAVPEGPVVLVGHSMGGMTVMALADQYPEYIAERVAGVAFLGTSAGGLADVTYGLPAAGIRAVRRVVPGVLRALVSQTELVERGRRAGADLFAGLVKRYSFGSARDVDPGVARFAERLIESVPVDVVAEFYPAFAEHEKTGALPAFDERPALVLAGDRDLLTPYEHSERIAAALPEAECVILEATGHLAMLERPREVNGHLAELLTRTIRTHGSTAPPAHGPAPAGPEHRRHRHGSQR
ncbi:alpha/beta fold hydrolase [Streptomyces iconiensis]|uniref:Alpha/beta hydrolase n=1 Tax=Streptomyces iconiensis TaxID=1384038 RepID=A0ABT7A3K1_9ACTN|nr:alpha/beta hydrolase [Streptomyces iconiensis]MDJ1135919.1 alpha/beta hydrolase [Streptomyces iconiensis]